MRTHPVCPSREATHRRPGRQPVPLHRLPPDRRRPARRLPTAPGRACSTAIPILAALARAGGAAAPRLPRHDGRRFIAPAQPRRTRRRPPCHQPASPPRRRRHRPRPVASPRPCATPATCCGSAPCPNSHHQSQRRRRPRHRRSGQPRRRLRRAGRLRARLGRARPPLRRPAGAPRRHPRRQHRQRLADRRQHARAHRRWARGSCCGRARSSAGCPSTDFYLGYRQTALAPGEFIEAVEAARPHPAGQPLPLLEGVQAPRPGHLRPVRRLLHHPGRRPGEPRPHRLRRHGRDARPRPRHRGRARRPALDEATLDAAQCRPRHRLHAPRPTCAPPPPTAARPPPACCAGCGWTTARPRAAAPRRDHPRPLSST
jgi:hypothetical protein